jgi:hypothetical protein
MTKLEATLNDIICGPLKGRICELAEYMAPKFFSLKEKGIRDGLPWDRET